jgi:hypothetical protein
MEYNLGQAVLYRFLRGFGSGVVATFGTIVMFSGGSVSEFKSWLFLTGVAMIGGGINGGLLALDKWWRETHSEQ